jgi:hypothetical protein
MKFSSSQNLTFLINGDYLGKLLTPLNSWQKPQKSWFSLYARQNFILCATNSTLSAKPQMLPMISENKEEKAKFSRSKSFPQRMMGKE